MGQCLPPNEVIHKTKYSLQNMGRARFFELESQPVTTRLPFQATKLAVVSADKDGLHSPSLMKHKIFCLSDTRAKSLVKMNKCANRCVNVLLQPTNDLQEHSGWELRHMALESCAAPAIASLFGCTSPYSLDGTLTTRTNHNFSDQDG